MKSHRTYDTEGSFTFFIYKADLDEFDTGWNDICYLEHDIEVYNGTYMKVFEMKDIDTKRKIENILNLRIESEYTPKNFIRTLESVNNSLYKRVGIKMNNEVEKDYIEKSLIKKDLILIMIKQFQ